MSESPESSFQAPEDTEVDRIELPVGGYRDGILPDSVIEQIKDSWGPRGWSWRILGGSALVLVITAVGEEYFRRKYGEKDE